MVDSRELSFSAIPLCQLLPCHLGPPRLSTLSFNLYVTGCLDCTNGVFPLLIHTSGAFSSLGWGPDPQCQAVQVARCIWWWQCLVAWHCRCLIIALSFHCRCWRFSFVSGQVSMAQSIVLHTQELYTWPCVLKDRWREGRTGKSSLNIFTCVVVESLPRPAAESMCPR